MKRLLIAIASLLVLAGCASDDEILNAGTGVRLTTVANAYTAPGNAEYVLRNGTDTTLQVPTCEGQLVIIVEKLVGGAWTQIANPPCPGAITQTTMAPGGTAGGSKPVTTPGNYRLRVIFTATGGVGNFEVLSNEFAVN